MGKCRSFFYRFHRRPRQQWQPQWSPLIPSYFSAGWVHPAAPARVPPLGTRYPARFLSHHRDLQPGFASGRNFTPTSSALQQALPPPVWRPPSRKKVVLSTSRFIRRSPMRLPSLQVPAPMEVTAEEPEKPMEVIAEEPEVPMEESMDDEVETQRQEEEKGGPHSNEGRPSTSRPLETQGNLASLECSPRALKGSVQSEAHGVPSAHSPARGVLPFGRPDPAPAVFPLAREGGLSGAGERAATRLLRLADPGEGDPAQGSCGSSSKQLPSTESCQPQFPTSKTVRATPAAATGPSRAMEVGQRRGALTR
ncbi:hypothetical protein P7K49_040868 [Saguinus oedipus]|uniref:Uncharacterized protein n=1 Tax=Saguinus oedipus TaxID=9490 RepID=A0ABQ9TC18_SAGOE|nr:hypothetical protein P7K49_040868 [Saguinus oedipus]